MLALGRSFQTYFERKGSRGVVMNLLLLLRHGKLRKCACSVVVIHLSDVNGRSGSEVGTRLRPGLRTVVQCKNAVATAIDVLPPASRLLP